MSESISRQEKIAAFYAMGNVPWDHVLPPPEVIAIAEKLPVGRFLDVGCGFGRASIYLAQRGWAADGVDFIEQAVVGARERAAQAGVASARFHQSSVTELGFLTPGYTLALDVGCSHSLESADLVGYHAHLLQLLAPGATLMLFGRLRPPGTENITSPRGYDEAEIRDTFTNGFTLTKIEYGSTSVGDATWPSAWFWYERSVK